MDIPKTTVVMIPIYEVIQYQPANIQRLLNEDYIDYLVVDQKEEFSTNNQFSILQSITCGDLDNKRYVLDGQHRIQAFKRLQQEGYPLTQYIPIILYKTNSEEELKRYYIRINQNHPVNPLELTDLWFKYGKEFCNQFDKLFHSYMKTSKCNCPNINIKEMMVYVKDRSVFERINATTTSNNLIELLIHQIRELNSYIWQNYNHMIQFQLNQDYANKLKRCYEKNKTNPCFLGLWRQYEWLEICVHLITHKQDVHSIRLGDFGNQRSKIPKVLRYAVWQKRNSTNMEGKCFVCNKELCYENMECGHIVPHVYNGEVSLENLEPICKMCNRDMGAMNLHEYKLVLESLAKHS